MACGAPGSVGCRPNRIPQQCFTPQQRCDIPQQRCVTPCYAPQQFLGRQYYNRQPYFPNIGCDYGFNNSGCDPSFRLAEKAMSYGFWGNMVAKGIPSLLEALCHCLRGDSDGGNQPVTESAPPAEAPAPAAPAPAAPAPSAPAPAPAANTTVADSTNTGAPKPAAKAPAPGAPAPVAFDWARAFDPNFIWPTLS
jgi:hypothetical protein